MASNRYEFDLDQASIWWTAIHIFVILVVGVSIFWLYVGGLFSAWFVLFVLAFLVLMVLSVPRSMVLSDRSLTINCVLDVTSIPISDIVSVRKVSPRKVRWVFPIFASCGFFGYYGYFFDFLSRRIVTFYATEWRYMVEIIDLDNHHYYISCRQRDQLIDELNIKMLLEE